jgi:hypothetical protein
MEIFRSVLGLAAAIPVALSLVGCGSSAPRLNTVTVERAIATSIATQRHLHATVRCPPQVQRKAGVTFTCTANLNVGTYPVLVTETNGGGHVRYQNQAPLVVLNMTEVEQGITRSVRSQRGLSSTVTCPAEVLQRAGIAFTCTVTVNGHDYPFAVTEVDGKGHVRYVEGR